WERSRSRCSAPGSADWRWRASWRTCSPTCLPTPVSRCCYRSAGAAIRSTSGRTRDTGGARCTSATTGSRGRGSWRVRCSPWWRGATPDSWREARDVLRARAAGARAPVAVPADGVRGDPALLRAPVSRVAARAGGYARRVARGKRQLSTGGLGGGAPETGATCRAARRALERRGIPARPLLDHRARDFFAYPRLGGARAGAVGAISDAQVPRRGRPGTVPAPAPDRRRGRPRGARRGAPTRGVRRPVVARAVPRSLRSVRRRAPSLTGVDHVAPHPGLGRGHGSYLLAGAFGGRVDRSDRDGNGTPGGPRTGPVRLGVRIPSGDPAPHRRRVPGDRCGTARHRQLGAPRTCGLLPHRPGRPDCGCARSAERAAGDRRCALIGGVDGVSPRLPTSRPRRG